MKFRFLTVLLCWFFLASINLVAGASPQWEYLVKSESELTRENPEKNEYLPLGSALTRRGQEGWELVAVTVVTDSSNRDQSTEYFKQTVTYIFKRLQKNSDA